MGVVFKAWDARNGQTVALKLLSATLSDDSDARERFQREARAASLLDHANICAILDTGEHEGRPFLVMPFIEGPTLRQVLDSKTLRLDETLRLASQLASALEAAHARGILHRDIKPSNIILDRDGNARILDFGLAKRIWKRLPGESTLDVSTQWTRELTTAGMPVGTIEYMSPEQIRGDELDARTDLFSLGLVLFEMATRQRAFEGSTPGVVIEKILTSTPPAAVELNPHLPPALSDIIGKLLERDRALRYQTASDLCADLKRLRRDKDSGVGASSAARRARLPARILRPLSPLSRGALVAGAVLLLALTAGILIRPSRSPALSERDTIVLTDFANGTGDAVFDGTLQQALAVELWQSPYLNIFPERRVRESLRMMGRSPEDRVTREVAREICLREGGRAFIAGSISSLGQHYVLTLEVVDAHTGEVLASEQAESASKEGVLKSLSRSASRLRSRLGESLNSLERFTAPLDQATTPSLEALRAFSLGNAERERGRESESIPFYRRALELDPNFALAEARLAAVYANLGETAPAVEHARRAYELRERVSERERYYIAAHYHSTVTGSVEKAVENYEIWKASYPRDATPLTNLSAVLNDLGQFDRALAEAQVARQLVNCNRGITSINIAAAHLGAGRFPAARRVLEQMLAENPESSSAPVLLFMLGCATRDAALLDRQLEITNGRPNEATVHQLQAQWLAAGGQLMRSREIFQHTLDLAQRYNRPEMEAATHARLALVESLVGASAGARASALLALRLAQGKEARVIAAQALARAGDTQRAEQVTAQLEKQYPEHTILTRVWIPTARAAIEIERRRPDRAIEVLRSAKPFELGFLAGLAPTYLRGQAFARAGDPARAAAEFERIVARPGVDAVSPLQALAWLELARASKKSGNLARSREAYQEFLKLWHNADPGLPLLQQAKAELAAL